MCVFIDIYIYACVCIFICVDTDFHMYIKTYIYIYIIYMEIHLYIYNTLLIHHIMRMSSPHSLSSPAFALNMSTLARKDMKE